MNRNTFIAVLLLSLGAGKAAAAQDTNAAAAPARISLQTLMRKNIFDPTRSGRVRPGSRPRAAVVRTFAFRGGDGYVAFFTGDGTPGKGYVKVGDFINGFKVRQISLDFVKLTDPNGKIVELTEGNTMRREEEGLWQKSDQPAPTAIAATETKADESTVSSSPASADVNDILAKLRLKRDQEEK